jgi:hypothetical protein
MPSLDLDNIYMYHAPTQESLRKFDDLRQKAKDLASLIQSSCTDSRERALAMSSLETALFWANAAVARHQ